MKKIVASCSIITILLLVLVGFCSFCKPNALGKLPVFNSSSFAKSYNEFQRSEVFVKVGQSSFTKADLESNILLLLKLSDIKAGSPLSIDRKNRIAKNVLANAMKHFVDIEMIRAVTSTNGLVIADDDIESGERTFYRQFLGREPTEDEIGRLSRSERNVIRRNVAAQLELDAYLLKNCSNELVVTEANIDQAMSQVRAWNDMVAATNAYAHAMASNIVKWVSEGRDFGELADKYSQDPDKKPGGLIDDHAAVWFSNGRTSYLDVLDQMPTGKVSDVLESIEGLLIVKALGKDPKTELPLYQRIVLQTGEPYPNYTREDLRQLGENQSREIVMGRLRGIAQAEVKVTYPHGESFFIDTNEKRKDGVAK